MTYEITLDTARDSTFSADITGYVREMAWANGMRDSYDSVSSGARLEVTLDNTAGDFSPEKAGAPYAGLKKGTRVRVRVSGTVMFLGKMSSLRPTLGVYGEKQVILTCDDPVLELERADYLPPLQLNVTVDTALRVMLDSGVVALPYARAFWLLGAAGASELNTTSKLFDAGGFVAFDVGRTTLPFVGDYTPKDFIAYLLAAEAGGRFFYDARSGKLVFHNRHRDLLNDTLLATLTGDDFEAVDYRYGDDVANTVTVRCIPREIGAAGSVIWSAANVPLRLLGGESRTIVARYRDPAQEAVFIGAKDFVPPQRGTDYVGNTAPDGSGSPAGVNALTVSAQFRGSAAIITLTNHRDTTRYVTKLQLRGTPLIAYDQQQVEASDVEAIRDNDARHRFLDVPAMSSVEDAALYAAYELTRFKNPVGRFASVTFVASKTSARLANAVAATIGSRVRISDSHSGHSADTILVGEQHHVRAGGSITHTVTWILKPVARDTFWVLGVAGKSEMGSTSKLAF